MPTSNPTHHQQPQTPAGKRPQLPETPSNLTPICPSDTLANHLMLTQRQAEVLHWVAEGKTNTEIGTILGCSFFTVKNHLKEIFQRLGVHSRTAAAAAAYRAHINGSNGAAVEVTPAAGRRGRKNGFPGAAPPEAVRRGVSDASGADNPHHC